MACNQFARQIEKKGYKLSDGPTPTNSGAMIAFIDAPEGYEISRIDMVVRLRKKR